MVLLFYIIMGITHHPITMVLWGSGSYSIEVHVEVTVMDNGKQYVIMDLVLLMLELSVNNWDITITIIMITSVCKYKKY